MMLLAASVLVQAGVVGAFSYSDRYRCVVCQQIEQGADCAEFNACSQLNSSVLQNFDGCEAGGFCPPPKTAAAAATPNGSTSRAGGGGMGGYDVRVTKGFGSKPYGSLRVSVITQASPSSLFNASAFEYSAKFDKKWTDNYISSSIVEHPSPGGKPFQFMVGNETISIRLPAQGAGVAGVIIADPCVEHGSITALVGCTYAKKFKTDTRTPEMLNALLEGVELDYWGILGDNFYDQSGKVTKYIYDQLAPGTKSKIMLTVPGNHDYWILGSPDVGLPSDQHGFGHAQWYAQDSKAAEKLLPGQPTNQGVPPFNFSETGRLANIENSFWYNQMGNLGVVGFSGAFSLEESSPLMSEACSWVGEQVKNGDMDAVLLVGHWDTDGMGASAEMAVPAFYKEMAALDGCKQLDAQDKFKFFMGHTHCNVPHPHGNNNTGWMVAGQGMEGCGNYGFTIFDTTEQRIRIYYFEVVSQNGEDTYDEVLQCINSNGGWRECVQHATVWLDQPLA